MRVQDQVPERVDLFGRRRGVRLLRMGALLNKGTASAVLNFVRLEVAPQGLRGQDDLLSKGLFETEWNREYLLMGQTVFIACFNSYLGSRYSNPSPEGTRVFLATASSQANGENSLMPNLVKVLRCDSTKSLCMVIACIKL